MLRFIIAIFLLTNLSAYSSEIEIETTTMGIVKVPIGVVPFTPAGDTVPTLEGQKPWSVIASDLRYSRRFLVKRGKPGGREDFNKDSISVIVTGEYSFTRGKVILDCWLHNYSENSMDLIIGKRYRVSPANLDAAAHRFSDEIIYAMFGEKGIASTRIAFVRKTGADGKDIFVMDYNGKNQTRITNTARLALFPCWGRGNGTIYYTSDRYGKFDLWKTDIFTGKTSRIAATGNMTISPDWNGVENMLVACVAVKGNSEIYIMEDGGGDLKRLTFRYSLESSPSWAPGGYEIAYTSDRSGSPQIYIMDIEGTGTRRLTRRGNYNDAAVWSPNGDRIAYMSQDPSGFNIYTCAPDGSDTRQLTSDAGDNEEPSWSPDGRHLVFTSTREGGRDVFLMDRDGSNVIRLTKTGNCYSPAWSGFMDK
ncbi:MAG: hypothetical protein ACLFQK_05665 [Fibrobacterota bacterium]